MTNPVHIWKQLHGIRFILLASFSFFPVLTPRSLAQGLEPTVYAGMRVQHHYFSLSYVEVLEQPEWTFHMVCKDCFGSVKRRNDFRADPLVPGQSAQLEDYQGSGYDRGHLVPAGDMTRNSTAMSETFFMSNMSPQTASFNRGIWKKLEEQIRDWSLDLDTIYVVTGPIIEEGFTTIGQNKVAVPQHYFKALYFPKISFMLGFILPNEGSNQPLDTFQVTIDEIEQRSHLDLFAGLPDQFENELESALPPSQRPEPVYIEGGVSHFLTW